MCYIKLEGNVESVIKGLSPYIKESDAKTILHSISSYSKLLDEDEYCKTDTQANDNSQQNLFIGEFNIYINLRLVTLALIALLLDATLTEGFASFVLSATGVDIRAVSRLKEDQGEVCVLLESKKRKCSFTTMREFLFEKSECINNNLFCNYCVDGACEMDDKRLLVILDSFVKRNILSKDGKHYCYNL